MEEVKDARGSRLPGFFELTPEKRLDVVAERSGLSKDELAPLRKEGNLPLPTADLMIENVVSTIAMPFGVGVNFLINGKEPLVPMALEEPSVVAAASRVAKLARHTGGIRVSSSAPIMMSQVPLIDVKDPKKTREIIRRNEDALIARGNEFIPNIVKDGGGIVKIRTRSLQTRKGNMVSVDFFVDVRKAMGANAVTKVAENIRPILEDLTGHEALMGIVSNLADKRLVKATVTIKKEDIGGEAIVDRIEKASALAEVDPVRAATSNKGVMNGVIAVANATGQDTRALEAGAHSYAARGGRYASLTQWASNSSGDLEGTLEMPMPVGIIGGAAGTNPVAKTALKMLDVREANDLAIVMGAVGLVNNFAAIEKLVTEGVLKGHMKLHERKNNIH